MDHEKDIAGRRDSTFDDHRRGSQFDPVNEGVVTEDVHKLKRNLHGRHMQMIAIGMSPLIDEIRMPSHHSLKVVPSVPVSSSVLVVLCVAVALDLWSVFVEVKVLKQLA